MKFEQGQNNISVIYLPDGSEVKTGNADWQGDEIRVSMEYGQMAGVPWFEVIKNEKVLSKWNAMHCLGVVFK